MAMRILTILLICGMLSQDADAQSLPSTGTETSWVLVNGEMVGGLELDTAQRRQLVDIERRYQRSYDLVLSIDTLPRAAMRDRLQALDDRREAEIRQVMSVGQYAQWQETLRSSALEP